MNEIIANDSNIPFLSAVKNASVGTVINEMFAQLTVVAIFENENDFYEERLSPTVLWKKSIEQLGKGVLLRKDKEHGATFIFVEKEKYENL